MKPIAPELYPFTGLRLDRGDGIRLHYLDEGPKDGEPVVFVHGNPTWSIHFRAPIAALKDRRRCIAIDHVGCGLSDKPGDDRYRYTLASRVEDLDRLIAHLVPAPRRITLVAHDWGGMIASAWAVEHPERVARIALMNTAAFHLPAGKTFPPALGLVRTGLGAFLVRGLNAFALTASHVCTTERRMPRVLRHAYRAPYASWNERIATLRFVEDIPLRPGDPSYDVVSRTADRLASLRNTPMLLTWGMRDFVFDGHFLDEWVRRFPHAEVHRFPRAGHYLLEDEPEAVVRHLTHFLDAHPG